MYEIQQFRRHDRAIINNQRERTYKLDGKTVAKNRRPRFEQEEPSLQDYLDTFPEKERAATCAKLKAIPSTRRYNKLDRKFFQEMCFSIRENGSLCPGKLQMVVIFVLLEIQRKTIQLKIVGKFELAA